MFACPFTTAFHKKLISRTTGEEKTGYWRTRRSLRRW